MSKTVLFFGNERLATGVKTSAPTLRALIRAGYRVAAVVSNYTVGTSRNLRDLKVAAVAKTHNIPLLLPDKLGDVKNKLQEYGAEAAILVAYGKIVPESIINIFPKGIINIHPSLLPLHRGPTPIESVILEGATETGVSLMRLVKAMDAGPVFAQAKINLIGEETKQELADKLLDLGSQMLIEHLPAILEGSLQPSPQGNAKATYDSLLSKSDGTIDWTKPALRIEREIRAFAQWPKSSTVLAGNDVIITAAKVVSLEGAPGTIIAKNKELIVNCGSSSLKINRLKPAGKKEMSAEAFLQGYKT